MAKNWFCWIFFVLLFFVAVHGDDTEADGISLDNDMQELNELMLDSPTVFLNLDDDKMVEPFKSKIPSDATNNNMIAKDFEDINLGNIHSKETNDKSNVEPEEGASEPSENADTEIPGSQIYLEKMFENFLNRTPPVFEESNKTLAELEKDLDKTRNNTVNDEDEDEKSIVFPNFGIRATYAGNVEMNTHQKETDSAENDNYDMYNYNGLENTESSSDAQELNELMLENPTVFPNLYDDKMVEPFKTKISSDATNSNNDAKEQFVNVEVLDNTTAELNTNITDELQNNMEDNKTENMNKVSFMQETSDSSENFNTTVHNETSISFQEESTSANDETFIDGSGLEGSGDNQIQSSFDDETGDDDDDFEPLEETTTTSTTTTSMPKNLIEMHKCHCSEVKECLTKTWQSAYFIYMDDSNEDLAMKCSLTYLKDSCTVGGNIVRKFVVANNLYDYRGGMCPCDEDSQQSLFTKNMQTCLSRKSCFIENDEITFNKMRSFCIEKIKKLSILNALKLSKEEIMALKSEYEKTFDEEFEDGRNPRYNNIFTKWFYQLRNKFCDAF